MRCRQVEDLLSAYIDDELEDGENNTVLEHIQACPDCQGVLKSMTIIKLSLQMPSDFDVSNELAGSLDVIAERYSKVYSENDQVLIDNFAQERREYAHVSNTETLGMKQGTQVFRRNRLRKTYSLALKLASLLTVIVLSFTVFQSSILTPKLEKPAFQEKRNTKANSGAISKTNSGDSKFVRPSLSSFGERARTVDEALSKVLMKPKSPEGSIALEPKEAYVLDGPSENDKGVAVVYKNGITILIHPKGEWYDFDARLKQSGLKQIIINDVKAGCAEPRTKMLQIEGKVFEPSLVIWYEGGIEYIILGDEAGKVGLYTLIPIARLIQGYKQ